MRNPIIIAAAAVLLIVAQLAVLRYLDYSTAYVSWIEFSPGDRTEDPGPGFSVGDLRWDMDKYREAPQLEKLREFFREKCGTKKGVAAASCVSVELIRMIPKGTPKREIFDSDYSPGKAFQKHLEGEQGFCTNYAGISSAMLLSVGVPARFIQIRAKDGYGGHNIIEIWDEKYGWVLFDPFNNGLIEENGEPLSAIRAHFAERVQRVDASERGEKRGHLTDYYDKVNRLRTTLVYPEPWLYTRTGNKQLPVVRGSYVGFGDGYFRYSLAQNLLRVGIMACAAVLIAAFGTAALRMARSKRG